MTAVWCFREGAPGHKECDNAIQQLNLALNDLDQASLAAVGQSLSIRGDGSLQMYQQQLINCARQLLEHIEPIRNAAKGEAENLGHLVSALSVTFSSYE